MKQETGNKKHNAGYSIIEVLAAFTIITVGLISVLALAAQNIKAYQLDRNTIVASQLAQEGLELVRSKRDENWLIFGNDWKTGAGAGAQSDIVQSGNNYKYTIDYSGNVTTAGVSDITSGAAKLKIAASGFYNHSDGTDTIFSRLITVRDQGDYLEVESRVRWQERGTDRNYIASTVLYNWR